MSSKKSNATKPAPKAPKKPAKAAEASPATEGPQSRERGPGRPPGAETIAEVVTVEAPRCKKCGSTERTKYTNPREHAHAGVYNGQPYTHVMWRSTTCETCGQARKDRFLENRSPAKAG